MMRLRRGQAMVEGVLGIILVSLILFISIHILRMMIAKILLDHAAARAARARAVGFNDFMCQKSSLVAIIPAAGVRTLPFSISDEATRIPLFLASDSWEKANGILDYKWWDGARLHIDEHNGVSPSINISTSLKTDSFTVNGDAAVESHYPLYMYTF